MKTLPFCHLVNYGNYDYPMVNATNIWSNKFLWDNQKKPILDVKKDNHCNTIYFSNNKKSRSLIPSKLVVKIANKIKLLI